MGSNINGPSLIRCPDWVEKPLGRYYLYFSHHRGTYIRMAYADDVQGPWKIHEIGALDLTDSIFPTSLNWEDKEDYIGDRFFYAHIASPDAHVLEENREIRLYYHGLRANGEQLTAVAMSPDGVNFNAVPGYITTPYLRAFRYNGEWFGIAMPGVLLRSPDGLQPYSACGNILSTNTRHCAVLVDGDILNVVWSVVGEAPERLYHGTINLGDDVSNWTVTGTTEVMRPALS